MATIDLGDRNFGTQRDWLGPRTRGSVRTWVVSLFLMTECFLYGCGSADKPQAAAPAGQAKAKPHVQTPSAPEAKAAETPMPQARAAVGPVQEISLFDGTTLGQWKPTDFGGQGQVRVKDGAIYMEMGNYMTGITWTGPVMRMNYEITLDAMRAQGNDFFCGLTFPVGESPCTLILGGWGGSLCGLSSLDHFDASENETTRMMKFETGKWYHVRLRVVPDRIQAWLDDENLVDVDVTGRKIDVRIEVELSKPLGIATYATTGAVRNIRLKKVPEQVQ